MTRRTGIGRTLAVVLPLVIGLVSCTSHPAKRAAATTPSTSPTATASTTPSPSPTPTALGPIAWVGPIGFRLPADWRVYDGGGFGNACLAPVAKRPAYQCSGLEVWYGWDSFLPGNEMTSFTQDGPGWYHNTDVQPCPVKPTDGKDGLNGLHDDLGLLTKGVRALGSKRADFYEWTARCENGYRFHPRAWYLPVTNVVVFDYMGYPDTADVVKTAIYDPGRWLFGFIDGVTSSSTGNLVHIDEAQWLSGPAAQAYAQKHGQQNVPDDYLIVDDDTSTYAAPLLASASIIGNIEMAGTEPDKPRPLTLLQFLAYERNKSHWGTTLHIHVDAEGRVDKIEEQYHP